MDPVDTNDASVSARDIGEQVCVATKGSQRYDNCSDTLVYASGTSFALRNKQTCIFKQHMSDTAVQMSGEHAGSQILLGLGKSRRGTDCYNNLGAMVVLHCVVDVADCVPCLAMSQQLLS